MQFMDSPLPRAMFLQAIMDPLRCIQSGQAHSLNKICFLPVLTHCYKVLTVAVVPTSGCKLLCCAMCVSESLGDAAVSCCMQPGHSDGIRARFNACDRCAQPSKRLQHRQQQATLTVYYLFQTLNNIWLGDRFFCSRPLTIQLKSSCKGG